MAPEASSGGTVAETIMYKRNPMYTKDDGNGDPKHGPLGAQEAGALARLRA